MTLTDDFFAAGTTNGTIGELGWAFTGDNIAKLVGQAAHPGILQRTSTSNAVLAETWLGHDANAAQAFAALSGVAFRAALIIKIENNSATTTIRMGFADDASAAPPNNGVYFENTTGTWTGVARSSSMSSTTSSSTTADNVFHTFQIVNDGANNVSFWDNDMLLGTVTSHVPGGALLPFFDIQSNNASSKSMDIDAFQFTMTVSR